MKYKRIILIFLIYFISFDFANLRISYLCSKIEERNFIIWLYFIALLIVNGFIIDLCGCIYTYTFQSFLARPCFFSSLCNCFHVISKVSSLFSNQIEIQNCRILYILNESLCKFWMFLNSIFAFIKFIVNLTTYSTSSLPWIEIYRRRQIVDVIDLIIFK